MGSSSPCWKLIYLGLLAILFFHGLAFSEKAPNFSFLHDATTAQNISYYDYIIVGGGTAGCALATTLSEKYTVLLLESGGSPYGNPNITRRDRWIQVLADVSPASPSQPFTSEDGVPSNRPRVLGGATAINAGFYSRAESSYVKEVGWDEKLVHESFEWIEDKLVFRPEVRGWQSAFKSGLVEAGVKPNNGFTYDHLIGTKVGGTTFDQQRRRRTSADLLEYANAKKITVLLHATVHQVLFQIKGKSRPTATGVVFADASGKRHRAYLKKGSTNEVIISSGALGSPQLLMLSGLGPKNHLQSLNISVVLDLPLVGQGMKDNPMNAISIPSPIPLENNLIIIAGITPFGSYIEGTTGQGTVSGSQSYGNGQYTFRMSGSMLQKVNGPRSFGHLELRNLDPTDNPSVRFNYYKDPEDLKICVKGVSTILRVIDSKAFSKYKVSSLSAQDILNLTVSLPQNFPVSENTSTSLEQFCKDTVRSIWHYHGGCQVGRVVDQDYKVIGVDGLRVVDGSTFNTSPGTNPQATVLMLGRYVGVKILGERLNN